MRVAPLAGSVDRNTPIKLRLALDAGSLPSRGAWIEIGTGGQAACLGAVAPLAGSVDRNTVLVVVSLRQFGRSPRGERG